MFQSDTAPRHDSVPNFHVAKLRSVDTTAIGDLPYLPYWIRMPTRQKHAYSLSRRQLGYPATKRTCD